MANPEEHARAAYERIQSEASKMQDRAHGKKEFRIATLEATVKRLQSEVDQMKQPDMLYSNRKRLERVEAEVSLLRQELVQVMNVLSAAPQNTEPPYDPAGWREYIKEFSPLLYGERPWEEVLVALGTLYGEYACSDIDQMKKSLARIVAICEYKTETTFLITRRPPEKLYFFSPFTLYTLFTPEGTEEEANRPGLWNYLDVGERAAEWLGSLYA